MPWFNSGMVEYNGMTLMAARASRVPSHIVLSELDDEWNPTTSWMLFGLARDGIMPEDPRLYVHDGRLCMFFVGLQHDGRCAIHRAIFGVGLDIDIVEKCRCLDVAGFDEIREQKNWVPFVDFQGELLAIYAHAPFTVLRRVCGGWRRVPSPRVSVRWNYGEIRGGTPPVWREDRWYEFFHSAAHELAADGRCIKVYYAGCATFDANFRPLTITPVPLLSGSAANYSQPWHPSGRVSAVFPCGAILRGGSWFVSYGWLDTETRIAEIDAEALDAAMEPVQ